MQIPGGLVCRLNGELVRQLEDCTQSVCCVSMTTRTIVPASTIPSIMLFTFWMLIVRISPQECRRRSCCSRYPSRLYHQTYCNIGQSIAAYENAGSLILRDAGCLVLTLCLCAEWLDLAACPLGFLGEDMVSPLVFPTSLPGSWRRPDNPTVGGRIRISFCIRVSRRGMLSPADEPKRLARPPSAGTPRNAPRVRVRSAFP